MRDLLQLRGEREEISAWYDKLAAMMTIVVKVKKYAF